MPAKTGKQIGVYWPYGSFRKLGEMYFGVPIIRIIYLGYFFGNSHIQAGRVSSLDSQVRNIAVYEKTLSKDLQFLNSPPSPPRYFIRVEAKGSNTWQFCSCSRAIQSRSGALWSRFQQTSANVGSLGLRPLRLKLNVSRFCQPFCSHAVLC